MSHGDRKSKNIFQRCTHLVRPLHQIFSGKTFGCVGCSQLQSRIKTFRAFLRVLNLVRPLYQRRTHTNKHRDANLVLLLGIWERLALFCRSADGPSARFFGESISERTSRPRSFFNSLPGTQSSAPHNAKVPPPFSFSTWL